MCLDLLHAIWVETISISGSLIRLVFTHLRAIDRNVVSKDSEKEKVEVVIAERGKIFFFRKYS